MPRSGFPIVRVLGPIGITGVGGPVPVGGELAARLLGALASCVGAPVPTHVLTAAVWGDAAPDGDRALRMAVSRLRRRLSDAGLDDAVEGARGSYRLAIEPDCVDSERFEVLAATGRRLRAVDVGGAATSYERALALWKGTPFAPFGDEAWAIAPASRLMELRLAVEEELADIDLERGREAVIVDRLRLATRAAPLRERRWVQLALALYRLERQADALRALRAVRATLRDELGIDPGPELQDIERRILAQDPGLLVEERTVHRRFPATELVGRDDEVHETERLLLHNRMVTIVGLGGSGKSALAAAVAERLGAAGHVVVVADLHGVSGAQVAAVVGGAFGVGSAGDDDHLAAAIAARIGRRRTVLLADGAETGASTTAALVEELLHVSSALRVLATARLPLGASGEVRLALDGLAVGDVDSPGPAMQLFLDRVGLAGAAADDDARLVVAQLCARAAGLPLAVELAAAGSDLHGFHALAHLDGAGGGGDAAGAVARAVDWALDVVPEPSRRLLEAQALLPGGFSAEAAAALAGVDDASESRRVLAPLLQTRLLRAGPSGVDGGVRYGAPDAVRQAVSHLLAASDDQAARARAFGHLQALGGAVSSLTHPVARDALARLDAELANVRHWLDRSCGDDEGLAFATDVARSAADLGFGAEASWWLRRHLAARPEVEPLARAHAVLAITQSRSFLAASTIDRVDLEAALVAAEAHEDWVLWLHLTGHVAIARGWQGDTAGALALLYDAEAERRLERFGGPWLRLHRRRITALADHVAGNPAAAARELTALIEEFLAFADLGNALRTIFLVVWLTSTTGDVAAAQRHLDRARELASPEVARGTQALLAAERAKLSRRADDPAAVALMAEAIDALEQAGNLRSAGSCRRDLGSWRLADGDRERGLRDLRASLPVLLRVDRAGAGVAVAELAAAAGAGHDDHDVARGSRVARLAGAAAVLVAAGEGAPLSPEQRQRVAAVHAASLAARPLDVEAGAGLDDEALIAEIVGDDGDVDRQLAGAPAVEEAASVDRSRISRAGPGSPGAPG